MRLTSQVHKVIVLQPVDGLELSSYVILLRGVEQVLYSGVLLVTAEYFLRLDSPAVFFGQSRFYSLYFHLPVAITQHNDATALAAVIFLGRGLGTGSRS